MKAINSKIKEPGVSQIFVIAISRTRNDSATV